MLKDIIVFSLSSSIELTNSVCEKLGITPGVSAVTHFKDGECIAFSKTDVRYKKVYIIQSTSSPVNDRIMETLIFIDAVKRANCREVNLVCPYFGYARQDRIAHKNEPITARMVADLFTNAGVKRIITLELHTPQIQGFFGIPLDNLTPSVIFANYLKKRLENDPAFTGKNIAIVAPDHGALHRARDLAAYIPNTNLVVIDKRRPRPNVAEITNVVGDINGKVCVMIDDIIDTGGTILAGAKVLKEKGARLVFICCAHALFNGEAFQRMEEAEYVEECVVTDSVFHAEFKDSKKIKVISLADMLADVIDKHESHEDISIEYAKFGWWTRLSKR